MKELGHSSRYLAGILGTSGELTIRIVLKGDLEEILVQDGVLKELAELPCDDECELE